MERENGVRSGWEKRPSESRIEEQKMRKEKKREILRKVKKAEIVDREFHVGEINH